MDLREIQLSVLNSLQTGVAPSFIHANAKLSADDQVAIYRDSITAAFDNTLETVFPVCRQLVGDDFFLAMGRRYQQQTCSCAPDINAFASGYPAFIREFSPAQSLPYLADVAALEWAMQRINVGTDVEAQLDLNALTAVPEAHLHELRFHCRENLVLLQSAYPLDAIWQAHQQLEVPSVDLASGPVQLVVWRRAFDLLITPVEADTWQFLQGCQQQLRLQQILEQTPIDLETVLAECISHTWLVNFTRE